jgi:hypothetical protein
VVGRPPPERILLLTDDGSVAVRLLPDGAPDRPGEVARLDAGDAQRRRVVVGKPQALVGWDRQVQTGVSDVVRRCRGLAGAPRGQVVGEPHGRVKLGFVEVVLEDETESWLWGIVHGPMIPDERVVRPVPM